MKQEKKEKDVPRMRKVEEYNLEYGYPSVDAALTNMVNYLGTGRRQGVKAAILIHGYGSTSTGGSIKLAVKAKLSDSSMRGVVRLMIGGEEWSARRREALALCGSLEAYERRIAGNPGVTVAILR